MPCHFPPPHSVDRSRNFLISLPSITAPCSSAIADASAGAAWEPFVPASVAGTASRAVAAEEAAHTHASMHARTCTCTCTRTRTRSRRVRRAVRSGGALVSHLARLAAVGRALALGALQQRRRERLTARPAVARGAAGRGRGGGGGRLEHRVPRALRSALSPLGDINTAVKLWSVVVAKVIPHLSN